MSGNANLEYQSVRERLENFLYPAFGQGRRQFLNNGTNFCRSESHCRSDVQNPWQSIWKLARQGRTAPDRFSAQIADSTHFCPMGPIRSQPSQFAARLCVLALSHLPAKKGLERASRWHPHCFFPGRPAVWLLRWARDLRGEKQVSLAVRREATHDVHAM